MGKQSTKTSTVYGNTTTKNPYVQSHTNNQGTTTTFMPGTALESVYNFVNKNINSLLDEYLNPNINSATNQAKLKAFQSTMNNNSYQNLENNIINPLSKRNMIRSSQASDLYRNLSESNNNALSSYINSLIADSQNNSASMINNLLSSYFSSAGIVDNNQKQSLETSKGNATKTQTTKSTAQLINDINSALNLGKNIGTTFFK